MGPVMMLLTGAGRILRRTVGRGLSEWTRLVEENPRYAAAIVEMAASNLRKRADNVKGWRKRRLERLASVLDEHAEDLRSYAEKLPCVGMPHRYPGTPR